MSVKFSFNGILASVQPRIRFTRSFDQRSHSYLGYVLCILGTIGEENREFIVAVGKAAHTKHQFHSGQKVSGECHPVADPRKEFAEFYKVSKLKVTASPMIENTDPPPWLGIPEDLQVYRERGHRRLSARTYANRCTNCIWGCRMAVEIIVDHWNPDVRRYRYETFCYGPKSCSYYKAGPNRKVPGRHGMIWEEPDWVDEDATSHRGEDD